MPEETRETDETLDRECVHFPMRVQPLSTRAVTAAALLSLATDRAQDPTVFDERAPFFFSGAVSTNLLDSYSTRMAPSSLTNFATDMETGVSLQDSHNTFKLGLGASLTGRMVRGKGEKPTRTEGEFYMLSGGDMQDVIEKIRAGIVRDMSVGFYGGRWVCDVCGGDMQNWRACPHWPGMQTTPEGADEPVTVTATIHEARLSEVSLVYDGATPGAGILKAIRAAEAGTLDPKIARQLETQYRIKLPAAHHAWAGADTRNKKEAEMPENDARAPEAVAEWTLPAAERERYRALVTECGLKPDASPAAIVEALRSQIASHLTERDTAVTERDTAVTERDTAIKERDALKPQAEDGVKFRTTLRKQVEETYIAAKGERANVAAKASAWDTGTIEFLQAELAEYEPERAARFPGGRLTTDGAPSGFVTPSAPASAFRA